FRPQRRVVLIREQQGGQNDNGHGGRPARQTGQIDQQNNQQGDANQAKYQFLVDARAEAAKDAIQQGGPIRPGNLRLKGQPYGKQGYGVNQALAEHAGQHETVKTPRMPGGDMPGQQNG